jgi:hypothetical protein
VSKEETQEEKGREIERVLGKGVERKKKRKREREACCNFSLSFIMIVMVHLHVSFFRCVFINDAFIFTKRKASIYPLNRGRIHNTSFSS